MKLNDTISSHTRLLYMLLTAVLLVSTGCGQLLPSEANAEAGNTVASRERVKILQTDAASTLADQELLADLYEYAIPSVVNIVVEKPISSTPFSLPSPFGLPDMPQQGEGSGFLYDEQGHIITNNHVVEDATSIIVNFYNGMWAVAELVATEPQADLAILQVELPEGLELQPLTIADPDSIQVGHFVVALGSPFSLDATMTLGIVSARGRSIQVDPSLTGPSYALPDVIQTDAAINPGNSGGPLLNLSGEVVGVNFAIESTVRANAGVGFAIPASVLRRVIPALLDDGIFHYAYLGISGQTITAVVAQELGLENNFVGVIVGEAVAGGPAAQAGIEPEDIIIGMDDEPIRRFEDLLSYLFRATDPGQIVSVKLIRDDDELNLDVELGERPREREEEPSTSSVEITIQEAISIAQTAVTESNLISEIESASARADRERERTSWIVTLRGEGKTALVVVDAQNGEVIELIVE